MRNASLRDCTNYLLRSILRVTIRLFKEVRIRILSIFLAASIAKSDKNSKLRSVSRGLGGDFAVLISVRRDGRVVEGARLESAYTPKGYRGFESHSLRGC